MAPTEPTPNAGPWRHRLALATALCAVPLVLFGGLVTTLRAGMAIDGWWVLEPGRGDHFLLFYPPEKWFRDLGTFTEHTHRLFGTLVGLLAIATVVAVMRHGRSAAERWTAVLALVAVCAQGALGGFRVLESSPQLAFLHGAFAQAVLAVLGASVVLTSRRWSELQRTPCKRARALRRAAWGAVVVVYVQIVLGAWLRHSGAALALMAHVMLVLGVVGAVMVLARELAASHADGVAARDVARVDRSPFLRARRNLHVILGTQLLLGVLATLGVYVFSGGFQGAVSTGEMIFATLHVGVGALLLVQCVAALLWSYRLVTTEAVPAREPASNLSAGALGVATGETS